MHTKILFVCLGNICRSPLAEAIFKQQLQDRNLKEKYQADSCGTVDTHVGERPDPRTIRNARHHGIEINRSARQLTTDDFSEFDLILTMDRSNFQNAVELSKKANNQNAEIKMIRTYDPESLGIQDVPDPWYGNEEGFEDIFQMLWRTCSNLIDALEKQPVSSKKPEKPVPNSF